MHLLGTTARGSEMLARLGNWAFPSPVDGMINKAEFRDDMFLEDGVM